MENEYMNVCVNAKPNTIILQSKPDEVTGGYADKDGVWHDFGGGGELDLAVKDTTLTALGSASSHVYRETTTPRASMVLPAKNNNYTVKAKDGYQIAVYMVSDPKFEVVDGNLNKIGVYYTSSSGYTAEEVVISSTYFWLTCKRNDNGTITAEEASSAYGVMYEVV